MANLEWIFDGIGTELISLIVGILFGGTAGYKIGSKNKQKQKAGDNSKQMQIGSVNYNGNQQTKSDRRR